MRKYIGVLESSFWVDDCSVYIYFIPLRLRVINTRSPTHGNMENSLICMWRSEIYPTLISYNKVYQFIKRHTSLARSIEGPLPFAGTDRAWLARVARLRHPFDYGSNHLSQSWTSDGVTLVWPLVHTNRHHAAHQGLHLFTKRHHIFWNIINWPSLFWD